MDAKPTAIEALLVHQEFLRALARGLLGRDDLADDVVQETYLKAVRHPPHHGHSPRGWLSTIARNTALRLRQREAQLPQKQARWLRKMGTGATPTPAEILDREALRQRVVRAVLSLPDKYREVLLLRYYEELPPRVIATRLSIPVETVRTRAKRALAQLRTALDEDDSQDWRTWALSVVPAGGLRGLGAGAATTIGVIAMKKFLLVVCTIALLVGGWWASDRMGLFSDRAGVQESTGDSLAHGDEGASSSDVGPQLKGAVEADATAPIVEVAPFGVVHGVVTDAHGRAVAGARVWVGSTRAPRSVASMLHGVHQTTSDTEGRFRFAPKEPADRVRAVADGYVSDSDYWIGGSAPVVLVLRRTNARVDGTLRDTDGNPVANALVHVGAAYGTQADSTGHSDQQGRYSVPFVTGAESYIDAWAPGFLVVAAGIPGFDAEGHAQVDLVLRPGYWIEGRVTDAKTGSGITGATLGSYERYGPVPMTDSEGRFRYRATREIDQITASADGYQSGQAQLAFAGGVARADLALEPMVGHELRGLVVSAEDEPVANALVLTPDARQRTHTDAQGRFRHLCWTGPGEPVGALVAQAGDATPAVVEPPKPGEEITLRLGRPAAIEGRVIMESGEPAAGALLRIQPGGGENAATRGVVLAALRLNGPHAIGPDGAFRLVGLPAGTYELQASAGTGQNVRPAKATVEVQPGKPIRGIEIRMPSGRVLHGRVVDSDGRAVPYADLSTYGEDPRPPVTADRDGGFRIVAMSGYKVRLHVTSPGYRLWHGDFTVTEEPVTITLRRCVRVRFILNGEVPPSGSSAMVWFREPGQEGWSGGGSSVVNGAVVHDLMHGAKTYEYILKGGGWETAAVRVDPVAGKWVLDVPVDVAAGTPARSTELIRTRPGGTEGEEAPVESTPSIPPETGTIHGRVIAADGEFGGTHVVAQGPSRTKDLRVGGVTHTVDDTPRQQMSVGPDGRFRLERIPVGAWTLFCRRGWRHENEIEVTVTANQTIEVNDLRAPERGVSIRGVVLDAAARPVVGLEVDARPRPLSIGSRPGRAKTASDGTFEIEDLAVGNYELSASDDRGQVAHRTVSAGSGDVELRFTEHGLVRGTLSGGWGDEDLPQGFAHILGLPEGRLSTSEQLQRNGASFYFERRLPPGEYRVAARIGPFVTAAETTVTVRAGEIAPTLDLSLVRGATVSVVLVDASREPQRRGWVDVPQSWHMGPPTEPDSAGVYRFESVPPGTWTLKGRARAGVGETVVDVAAGETVRAEIELRK